ncbi:CgeB family protein [Halalkalibacterium halodurans]|uniref:CgeB family protein n=1 Tax=Halalkalibacterium halodurans TaxID=86665 RepID=UPI002AA9E248|nr:glycosyltransferase [Halalkalibacterium halodurans]MDY7223912.1 glycosyltransferase [Halalkalibacterium halodurans]MDY7243133.1 glycosyltransferase [Halalkalibacterium halodurans]
MSSRKRIVFIGRYTEGQTGIVKSIHLGLIENGFNVLEINVQERPQLIDNPQRNMGGNGPVYVKWKLIEEEVLAFKPDIILFCAGGLTFKNNVLTKLKEYCTVMSMTLSDPDVFPTISKYISVFDYHTTNSRVAYQEYIEKGIKNTLYMPFGIDSRFFVPRSAVTEFQSDVAIIGHYRENRLDIAKKLQENFHTKIFGRDWPIKSEGPVYDEDWFKAMYSSNILVNFPQTGAGFTNVKVGIFEAIATGRLVMTEYFDEMKEFFKYDKEIVGYKNSDDLMQKIKYFLNNPQAAQAIAKEGQKRCASDHTWKQRLADIFKQIPSKKVKKTWEEWR